MRYAIRFVDPDDPGGAFYAGDYNGAMGFAPTLKTALIYDDEETARRALENGYGTLRRYGNVIAIEAAANG